MGDQIQGSNPGQAAGSRNLVGIESAEKAARGTMGGGELRIEGAQGDDHWNPMPKSIPRTPSKAWSNVGRSSG
jgi:hypothetical protein